MALVPLWQLAQVPAATLAWLYFAGVQELVLWQLSQGAEVAMWPAGFPLDPLPLWQVVQEPGATPMWSKRAPLNDVVLWQLLQACLVGMWVVGRMVDARCPPLVWQPEHRVGVPLNTPRTWQDSQRALWCAPVRANPVLMWSKRALPDGAAATSTASRASRMARHAASRTAPRRRGDAGKANRFIVTLQWTRPGTARGGGSRTSGESPKDRLFWLPPRAEQAGFLPDGI